MNHERLLPFDDYRLSTPLNEAEVRDKIAGFLETVSQSFFSLRNYKMIGKDFENPEEKYNVYYKGIRNILMAYLPKGEEFKEARQIIYDEKNIFLNAGKKKSDYDGVRKSDGRMTFQYKMNEMLDVIVKWVSESQNPFTLYNFSLLVGVPPQLSGRNVKV